MSKKWQVLFFVLLASVIFLLVRDVRRMSSRDDSVASDGVRVVTNVIYQSSFSSPSNGLPLASSHLCENANFGVHSLGEKRERLEMPSEISSSAVSSPRYIRGVFEFGRAGSDVWVYFDGCLFKVGCPCEFGRVSVIERDFAICVDEDKTITYLLPSLNQTGRPPIPSPRFISSGDGMGGGRPWYYVHTGTERKNEDGKN